MNDFEKIKEAVLKNRGGLEAATDDQIFLIWNALDAQTQEKYLDSTKKNPDTRKQTPENRHQNPVSGV
jgi:tRNA G46 methylase TrmB